MKGTFNDFQDKNDNYNDFITSLMDLCKKHNVYIQSHRLGLMVSTDDDDTHPWNGSGIVHCIDGNHLYYE